MVQVQLVSTSRILGAGFVLIDCALSFSITASAFSCAIAICALVIFFALQRQGIELDWSGNNLPFEGLDAVGPRLKVLAEGEHFGPGVGEF